MLAKEHKITIEEGERWAANIKKRVVYFRKDDIYNLSEDHLLGLTLHEVAHIHYTDDIDMTPHTNPELTHSILNMLEDNAIEHIIGGDYPNAGEILESTNAEVLDTLIKILPKYKGSQFEKSLLYAAARFKGRGYKYGITQYEKIGSEISEIMLKKENEILNRRKTADLMPMVIEIRDLLIKYLGEPTQQEKDAMAQENNIEGNAQKQNNRGQTNNAKKQLIDGLKAGTGWKPGAQGHQGANFIDAIADQSRMIGKQLRTVLKRNNAMEFGGRYRTGKLLSKRFVRVVANKDRNPFARRIVKSNQSYAFAVASDISGSMFGYGEHNNASYALTSMHMVGEALRIAGIPRSLILFGQNAHCVAPTSKIQIPWSDISSDRAIRKAGQNSTYIDRAMLSCIEQLGKVRAERKIMIILTDGSSHLPYMQDAHKKATAEGIECLAITVGSDVHQMNQVFGEKKNTQIANTSDTAKIGKAFIDILKKSVARG